MKSRYTSMLRVGEYVLYSAEQREDLWRRLEAYPGCFDELVFFTQATHSVRSLEELSYTAEQMVSLFAKAKDLGLRTGIDMLCTIGHLTEHLDKEMETHRLYTDPNGNTVHGKLCPCDPENRTYIRKVYRIFAALNPSVLYVDDDVSYMSCFCRNCICRFGTETHLLPDDAGLADLQAILYSEDPVIRRAARKAWSGFNAERIDEILNLVTKTVHAFNPKIEIGFMTCSGGSDGLETNRWADTMRDGTGFVRWRPGGGVYTEFTPNEVLDKAHRIGIQIRYLPCYAETVESEIENFPYQSLRKSPSFTAFEVMTYLAAGCTGAAFNICSGFGPDFAEHDVFFRLARDIRQFGNAVTETFGRVPAEGIGIWWDRETGLDLRNRVWNTGAGVPVCGEPYQIGLPAACDPDHMFVFLLDEDRAALLSDEILLLHLQKGVMMDTGALDECNRRGFSRYTGFRTAEAYPAGCMERDLDHPMNRRAGCIRDVRQSFGWYGTAHTIEGTDESAAYLSELIDYRYCTLGYCCGIFENELGGRIAVGGFAPFTWCMSLARSVQLKNIIRWLSCDRLPAYLHSFHRMSLWARNGAVFICNPAMECARGAELAIRTNAKMIIVTVYSEGKTVTEESLYVREDGVYSVFRLPDIQTLGCALVKIKNTQKEDDV